MTIVRRHLGVSSLVTRRALVRRRLRGVVLCSLVGKDCDPSLLLVSGGRSLVVTRRALVRRRLRLAFLHFVPSLDDDRLSSLVASLVYRRLRVVIIPSLADEDCGPSLCVVSG